MLDPYQTQYTVRWPSGRGGKATDIGLKFGTSLKIPPRGRRGIKSRSRRTFTGYPTAKSTYRLNFLSCGPVAEGVRRRTLASSLGPPLARFARGKVKWLLMNIHKSLVRLGSEALVGSQPRRRTTPNRNPRVSGMLDRLDM